MLNGMKSAFGGRKSFTILIVALALLVLPAAIFAQNQIQNQNSVQVQKQTEKSIDIQQEKGNVVATQEGKVDIRVPSEGEAKLINLRNAVAREHMSVVAQKVEQLLSNREEKGGIGQQVREIAQQQKQVQEEVRQQLEKIEARQGFLKKLIGPNFKAIRNVRQHLEQNQLRVERLEQLRNQLSIQTDEDNVDQAIQALKEQGEVLQEQITAEEHIKSAFGWLFRLFNR